MKNNFKIIVTTRDHAHWLGHVLDWYQKNNLEPLFIVDARTKDATRELIERYGFSFKEFLPRGDFPEAGMLEFGARQSDTDWILRLDDDELPNLSLLDWVRDTGIRSKNQCWFISRRELFFCKHQILYSRSMGKYPLIAHPDQLHPVARLYHRQRVEFLEEIHTTGLKELLLYGFVPNDNFIIHFNCLIHPMSDRLKKLEFYHNENPSFGWNLADEYLPELFSQDFHQARNDGLDEFLNFFEKMRPELGDFDLSDARRELIITSVKKRAREILSSRHAIRLSGELNSKHFSADDVSWLEATPAFLRQTLVQLIGTFFSKRNRNYARAIWNYYEIYLKKRQ